MTVLVARILGDTDTDPTYLMLPENLVITHQIGESTCLQAVSGLSIEITTDEAIMTQLQESREAVSNSLLMLTGASEETQAEAAKAAENLIAEIDKAEEQFNQMFAPYADQDME